MTGRRFLIVAAAVSMAIVTVVLVGRNQVKVYRSRQERVALAAERQALFEMLRPVALGNCQLERFGEANDGGYLMCGNLLAGAASGYSYGISGYDKWGCDISTRLNLTVHQYDCFNTTQPSCPGGTTVFHPECVGDTTETIDGRVFDTIGNQLASNGDGSKRIVLKIDVEGAEWDSLLSAPDEVLQRIDQMAVEFHWVQDEQRRSVRADKYLVVVERLKQFFEVGHIHFNNASCVGGLEPFPTWAFEVLFVSKRLSTRLAVAESARAASGRHALDAPNDPSFADCQPKDR